MTAVNKVRKKHKTYTCARCRDPILADTIKTGESVAIGFEGRMNYFHMHCVEELKVKKIVKNLRKLNRTNRTNLEKKKPRGPLPRFIHAVSAAHEPDEDTKQNIFERVIECIRYYGPLPVKKIHRLTEIDKSSVRFAIWANSSHTNPRPKTETFIVVGKGQKGVQIWGLAQERKPNDHSKKSNQTS